MKYQIIENNTTTTMSTSSSTAIIKLGNRIASAKTQEKEEYKEKRVSIYAPSIGRIKDAITSKDKFLVLYDMDEDMYRRHSNDELIRAVHLYFLSVDSSTEKRHRDAMRQIEIAVRNDLSYGNENYARYYEKYKEYFKQCLNRDIEPLHAIEFLAIEKQYRKNNLEWGASGFYKSASDGLQGKVIEPLTNTFPIVPLFTPATTPK